MSWADMSGNGRSGARMSGFDALGDDADAEYVRLTQEVTDSIGTMMANVSRMSGLVSKLGGPKDTPRLRDTLSELSEATRGVARRTGREIKVIGTLDGGSANEVRQRKMQQAKLAKDFEAALSSYKEVESIRAQKEKAFVRKARASMSSSSNPYRGGAGAGAGEASDSVGLLAGGSAAQLQLAALESEVDYNDAIIRERESEIKDIESTIQDVSEIFADLHTIVMEQGDMLNEVDAHIESTVSHTEGAAKELRIADGYHRSATRKKFMCFLIVFIICIVLIIALSVGLKKR